ncbi:MAG TPA: N-acetylneuraminate synthase [Aurantimonas coralicida]|uniref:N-acetylneuraminate synthase n=2 Tax=root TaxID=1 RepID=A0A9C9NE73_9HYPH|nr:N-acetylneuraminate synthase [Aurantimonas coralicida]HET99664.1 N-acetylneuraminate synthase [Aurantimonas coralicida]
MVFVIAEAGVNHNGDVDIAHKLVEAAASAGADAVKFQTFDAERLDPPGARREMLAKLQLSHEAHFALKKQAMDLGIEFMSTPFDLDSLRFLVEDVMVGTLKIGSGQLDNAPLLEAARMSPCHLIVSTGMATMEDVGRARGELRRGIMLHCTSAYPAPPADINLRAMVAMREKLGCPVGLSDHTDSTAIPIAAVALGAEVIEKHLTLDPWMRGPDHAASLDPHRFSAMVTGIRSVELALGDGVKRPQASEAGAIEIAAERRAWREKNAS